MDAAVGEAEARVIRAALVAWFAQAQRPLPWRQDYAPYAVWVSEVMLQQTQVETVLPYYARWMARFPTLASLAAAPEQEVLKAWQGLGYYARARNFHRAAQAVQQQHGGRIPETVEGLRALPGVGPYTAGAVASIAFNQPAPLVDGNVGRVLGRLFALAHPPRSPQGQALLWRWAQDLVPPAGGREFNQALMELGALICRDKSPACLLCPLSSQCRARAAGNPQAWPPKAARKTRPTRTGVMLVLCRGDALLLRRRPSRGIWGGLWEFPWAEAKPGTLLPAQAGALLPPGWHLPLQDAGPLGPVCHGLTHFALELQAHRLDLPLEAALPPLPDGWAWVPPERMADYPQARLNTKARALLPEG